MGSRLRQVASSCPVEKRVLGAGRDKTDCIEPAPAAVDGAPKLTQCLAGVVNALVQEMISDRGVRVQRRGVSGGSNLGQWGLIPFLSSQSEAMARNSSPSTRRGTWFNVFQRPNRTQAILSMTSLSWTGPATKAWGEVASSSTFLAPASSTAPSTANADVLVRFCPLGERHPARLDVHMPRAECANTSARSVCGETVMSK